MTKKLIKADYDQLWAAYDNWANVIREQTLRNRYDLFYDFLNLKPSSPAYNYEFDEEGEQRMHMLLGPYCQTIMRAWFLLNDLEWK